MPRAYAPCKACGGARYAGDVGRGMLCFSCRLEKLDRLLQKAAQRPTGSRGPQRDMERELRVSELFRTGYTLQEIGTAFNVSRERIRQILARAGLTAADGGQAKKARNRRAQSAIAAKARRDARAVRLYGCDWETLVANNDGKPPCRGSKARAFFMQAKNAEQRGVDWCMTFPEWIGLWMESGHWDRRGRGRDKYVMARKQDFGPYATWNVYITTQAQNAADYQAELKKRGVMCSDGYRRLPERAKEVEAA